MRAEIPITEITPSRSSPARSEVATARPPSGLIGAPSRRLIPPDAGQASARSAESAATADPGSALVPRTASQPSSAESAPPSGRCRRQQGCHRSGWRPASSTSHWAPSGMSCRTLADRPLSYSFQDRRAGVHGRLAPATLRTRGAATGTSRAAATQANSCGAAASTSGLKPARGRSVRTHRARVADQQASVITATPRPYRRARAPASVRSGAQSPGASGPHGCRQDRYSSAEKAKGRLVDLRRVCFENLRDDLPSSTIVSPGLAVHIRSSRCFSCTEAPMNRSAITGCGDMFDSAALRTGGGPTARHKAACWICGSDRRGRPLAAPIILGRGTANAHGACEPKHAFLTGLM